MEKRSSTVSDARTRARPQSAKPRRSYDLRLFGDDKMVARLTVEADSNVEAAAIGTAVFQACGDFCTSFDVRRDTVWIAGMAGVVSRRQLNVGELPAAARAKVSEIVTKLSKKQRF